MLDEVLFKNDSFNGPTSFSFSHCDLNWHVYPLQMCYHTSELVHVSVDTTTDKIKLQFYVVEDQSLILHEISECPWEYGRIRTIHVIDRRYVAFTNTENRKTNLVDLHNATTQTLNKTRILNQTRTNSTLIVSCEDSLSYLDRETMTFIDMNFCLSTFNNNITQICFGDLFSDTQLIRTPTTITLLRTDGRMEHYEMESACDSYANGAFSFSHDDRHFIGLLHDKGCSFYDLHNKTRVMVNQRFKKSQFLSHSRKLNPFQPIDTPLFAVKKGKVVKYDIEAVENIMTSCSTNAIISFSRGFPLLSITDSTVYYDVARGKFIVYPKFTLPKFTFFAPLPKSHSAIFFKRNKLHTVFYPRDRPKWVCDIDFDDYFSCEHEGELYLFLKCGDDLVIKTHDSQHRLTGLDVMNCAVKQGDRFILLGRNHFYILSNTFALIHSIPHEGGMYSLEANPYSSTIFLGYGEESVYMIELPVLDEIHNDSVVKIQREPFSFQDSVCFISETLIFLSGKLFVICDDGWQFLYQVPWNPIPTQFATSYERMCLSSVGTMDNGKFKIYNSKLNVETRKFEKTTAVEYDLFSAGIDEAEWFIVQLEDLCLNE
ncbi:hypothetical protein PCE1_004405 [Barthelona sp. PCE]